ncbi:hypothetical protein AAFF_G00385800 [Aldrovandia affinis]|uniref:Uncharacterized protein n=1 Tax=Aldrovandia affinis TaxID=143900 RepID=A0AAD7SEY0_9TELE|nr:hypothetical protein AAFF_G00385800 [Aldrovandia affinis]
MVPLHSDVGVGTAAIPVGRRFDGTREPRGDVVAVIRQIPGAERPSALCNSSARLLPPALFITLPSSRTYRVPRSPLLEHNNTLPHWHGDAPLLTPPPTSSLPSGAAGRYVQGNA